MNMVMDALGRRFDLPNVPQRIVSLVPSLTEWLFALWLNERIVGVTDFCTRPSNLVIHKVKVRGTKNPNRATIFTLKPDLVIANKEENRQRDVDALTTAGVPVYVTDIRSLPHAIDQLGALADLLGVAEAAQPYLDDIRQAYTTLTVPQTRQRVLALIWREPWMAIGGDTYSHDLLERCGAHNAGADLPGRYPRFDLDDLSALELDRILLLSEPYAFSADDLPPLQAHFNGPIDFVDGELLTWYGPRISLALRKFGAMFRSFTAPCIHGSASNFM